MLAWHRVAVCLAIVLASIAVRGLYFAQLGAGPGIAFHRLDETDMNYYGTNGSRSWLPRAPSRRVFFSR